MGGAWSWCHPGSWWSGVPGSTGGWSPDPGVEEACAEMSCLSLSSAALSLFAETPPSPEARVGVAAEAGNMEIAVLQKVRLLRKASAEEQEGGQAGEPGR